MTSQYTLNKKDIGIRSRARYSTEFMGMSYLSEYDLDGKKQKILLIDVNCKNSSTGKIVYDLFQYLNAKGRNAEVCYGRGPSIKEKGIYKFGLDFETFFHAAFARITGYNGYFSPLSTIRLIKYIKKFKPDIIHIHELHAYFINIKQLFNFIKKNHIKVITTLHCEYMYTGKCGHAYDCIKYRSCCGKCPALHEYPKSLFFDKTKQMFLMKKNLYMKKKWKN
jgi:glycosyltransferase involved in cell wall biosynthesis